MTARLLVICSVAFLALTTLNGCYTVFRTGDLAGRHDTPEETVAHGPSGADYSGDVAFSGYEHDRWSYYLRTPWWEQSLLLRWVSHQDGESRQDTPPPIFLPAPRGSGGPLPIDGMPGVEIPSRPVNPQGSSSKEDGDDVRYKDDSSGDSNSPTDTNTSKTDRKPARRKTGGGDK